MEEIKKNLSKNLLELRKSKNLTQLELAQQLNYSDKSISKWEHGDAVPDVAVLKQLAKFYGVTIDFLIGNENNSPIDTTTTTENSINNRNKIIITLLATSVVWIIATIVYTQLKIWADINYWKIYIWSLPVSFIVLIVFNAIWRKKKFSVTLTSLLVWTLLLSFYLQFLKYNIWIIFLIGAPMQISIILWAQLQHNKKNKTI